MRHPILSLAALLVAALSSVATAGADDLATVIERAKSVNETWSTVSSDFELATLRHERTLVESGSDRQTLVAELSYAGARSAWRAGFVRFTNEIVDASYAVVVSRLRNDASRLALGRAVASRNDAEARSRSGLASQREVTQARIGVGSAELDAERAGWQLGDALDDYRTATGIDRVEIELPDDPGLTVTLTEREWVERDQELARAQLGVQIAELELARLASNAARYDRRTAEIELEIARAALVRARRAAEQGYEAFVRRVSVQQQIIRIAEEQLRLSEGLASEADVRYERDLSSVSERDQNRINVLQARVGLLEAQRDLVKTILEYAVVAELEPDQVL